MKKFLYLHQKIVLVFANPKYIRIVILAVSIVGLTIVAYRFTRLYINTKIEENQKIETLIQTTLTNVDNQLVIHLNNAEHIPQSIAIFLENTPISDENLKNIFWELINKHKFLCGIGNGYETKNSDGSLKMNILYYYRKINTIEFTDEPLLTDAQSEWYAIPKRLKIPVWIEPYIDTLSDYGEPLLTAQMISYSVPYVIKHNSRFGVITIDIYLDYFKDFFDGIKVLKNSSFVMLSPQKNVIYSKNQQFLMHSLDDLSLKFSNDNYKKLSKLINEHKHSVFVNDSLWGYTKNVLTYKVLKNGMVLCINTPYDEFYSEWNVAKKRILTASIIWALVILSLMLILYFYLTKKFVDYYNKTLEKTVMEQTAELRTKNEELIAIQDELNQVNDNIIQAFETVDLQKKELEKINKKLTDSISYAKYIQQSLLPSENEIRTYFKEYFIIYRPKDVVSGDFYFLKKVNNYLIFAVGDCTGHGVPGAFMALLSISYLHQIVIDKYITKSSTVLERLRYYFSKIISNFGIENQNGLDIAFCAYDFHTKKIQFSGAYLPLIIVRDGQIIEIKGVRCPIGYYIIERNFEQVIVDVKKGDQVYLMTDGYQTQLSMTSDTYLKLGSVFFKDMLINISNQSMVKQEEKLLATLEHWQGAMPQTDDITIWGIKWDIDDDAINR